MPPTSKTEAETASDIFHFPHQSLLFDPELTFPDAVEESELAFHDAAEESGVTFGVGTVEK